VALQDDDFEDGQPYALATIAESLDLDIHQLDAITVSQLMAADGAGRGAAHVVHAVEPEHKNSRILVTWPRDASLEAVITATAANPKSSVITLILDDGSMSCANFRYIRLSAPEVRLRARTHAIVRHAPRAASASPTLRALDPALRDADAMLLYKPTPDALRAQSLRTGECDRRIFGPIAIALRDGPHEAASVREAARMLSKLLIGRDATAETSDPIMQLRWMAYDAVRGCVHPTEGRIASRLSRGQAQHPHAHTQATKRHSAGGGHSELNKADY
jgi:hypothetical protein